MLISYHLELFKGVFWFLVRNSYRPVENHDTRRHMFVLDAAIKK